MLFEAQLNCVHPLCRRWPINKKQVRRLVYVRAGDDPLATAKRDLADRRLRRCNECRRPVSLKHLVIVQINLADGSYMESAK